MNQILLNQILEVCGSIIVIAFTVVCVFLALWAVVTILIKLSQ